MLRKYATSKDIKTTGANSVDLILKHQSTETAIPTHYQRCQACYSCRCRWLIVKILKNEKLIITDSRMRRKIHLFVQIYLSNTLFKDFYRFIVQYCETKISRKEFALIYYRIISWLLFIWMPSKKKTSVYRIKAGVQYDTLRKRSEKEMTV